MPELTQVVCGADDRQLEYCEPVKPRPAPPSPDLEDEPKEAVEPALWVGRAAAALSPPLVVLAGQTLVESCLAATAR